MNADDLLEQSESIVRLQQMESGHRPLQFLRVVPQSVIHGSSWKDRCSQQCVVRHFNALEGLQNDIIMWSERDAICYLTLPRVQFKTQLFLLGDDCLDVVYNDLAWA